MIIPNYGKIKMFQNTNQNWKLYRSTWRATSPADGKNRVAMDGFNPAQHLEVRSKRQFKHGGLTMQKILNNGW